MRRLSLIVLSFFLVLVCNAQNQKLPTPRKKGGETKVENSQTDNYSNAGNANNATFAATDNNILQEALKNTFIVVQQSYNIRKNGLLVDGNDFFGHRYAVLPILTHGYAVDALYEKPWENDKRYAEYADCSECLVTVDRVQYKKLSDKGDYNYFNLNDRVAEALATDFFYIQDDHFDNKGLEVVVGNGVKKGYMVWFTLNNGEVTSFVQPITINFNENMVYSLPQPRGGKDVLGGYFVNLNLTVPGTITMELMGVARYELNDGGKWELVKMQKEPDLFMFTKEEYQPEQETPTFNSEEEKTEEYEFGSDEYIRAQQKGKKRK